MIKRYYFLNKKFGNNIIKRGSNIPHLPFQ